jgi:tRNA pseudouridine65 synthase
MEIPILYEDEYCLVVNKPSNLIVHHSSFARNIEETSLTDLVREKGFPNASPVHRLDRKTSGCLLFSKEKEFVSTFQQLFESDQIEKKYTALVRGWLPESGVIDSPVKNERGNYKEALTLFKTIELLELPFAFSKYPTQRYSLVELSPKTGRYHQLRIHCAKIGHPIINDPKHGDRHHNHFFENELGITNLFLHAEELNFIHPFINKKVQILDSILENWKELLEKLST